ncbi:type IV toxin-antitoxin system AbiEi family antitoxin domain-containing protein [Phytoactinopolyspora halotolerans]|uniref:Type IV toxin-antitoxin system AbiEi family antitoxin domain-containing protein n=1 Tax=Phytoactinopolyspora halotolerans TaxID=1981512 RepID=A0A6L9S7J4_9ACTN|nr:type IV toxin-antitoxin system AbiEi family antitoxin domain-containing protein [Phytoactinopolyspora halotolerans]NEE00711.1 type IV toxin-antitoxin system AbiEi family antitoxin domain-containing protein [Phytoactinopolyspora halotolerans]
MKAPPELAVLAAAQDGLITRQQALGCGVSQSAIRHALRPGGEWQRLTPGIYATFTGPLQERHWVRAALLYAGPAAVVTGAVACRAYGMRYLPSAATLELLVPPHVRRAPIPFAMIHRVTSMPAARMVRGIACAPPERAALDAVRGEQRLRDVRATLSEVVQRKLTTLERLVSEHDRIDRRGLTLARVAFDDIAAGCRSAPECDLRDLIRQSLVLPEPCWNGPLPDAPEMVPDAYYKEARLALEVDSVEWHGFGEAAEQTERRRALYARLGWRVLPISPHRIREEPMAVLAEIEAAVTAGLSSVA